ncbi:uncharacterized protein PG986_002716 [Apiospora aurea]|uniref:Peptidase S8/S53 domain-containing protein n=1 Tax=Apiospora aurea TaxID=335848 RepID=A0ABR1QPN0_9PEZI
MEGPLYFKKDRNGFEYKSVPTSDPILQILSSDQNDPSGSSPAVFWSPENQDKKVAIYVLERAFDSRCFKGHDGAKVESIDTKRLRAEDLVERSAVYDAERPDGPDKHGVAVLNRIGSAQYGSCRGKWCRCFVVRVRRAQDWDTLYDVNQWGDAMGVIGEHFRKLREQHPAYEFAVHRGRTMELVRNPISYSVDYWVRGQKVEYHEAKPKNLVENGTSHACPIAVGVIASMLSAGHITSTKPQDVRAYLDQCAVAGIRIQGHPTKHLRNHPGFAKK